MKKFMQMISYSLIILNMIFTGTLIWLFATINKVLTPNNFVLIWVNVFLFTFVFVAGITILNIYRIKKYKKLLLPIGICHVIPIPFMSIINIILLSLFLTKINDIVVEQEPKNKVENNIDLEVQQELQ